MEGEIADPESAIEYTEMLDGRQAVRLRQESRDFSTLWFDVGERSVRVEAYVMPAPPSNRAEVFRQCLVRNGTLWRVRFCLDQHGDVVLRGRIAIEHFGEDELGRIVGEIFDAIEVGFRPLVRAGFGDAVPVEDRETSS